MQRVVLFVTLIMTLSTASELGQHHILNKGEFPHNLSHPLNTSFNTGGSISRTSCNQLIIERGNFLTLEDSSLFVPFHKKIYDSSSYQLINERVYLCMSKTENSPIGNHSVILDIRLNCETWDYEPGQYRILKNGSVVIGDGVFTGRLKFVGKILHTCFDDHGEDYNVTVEQILIRDKNLTGKSEPDSMALVYSGNIGSCLSIVALFGYLVVFGLMKELRNGPGCNLASLSVSLLLGYLFFLVGQIPEVVGTFCYFCAVISQYLFLASFFWMNCISYDVWRTLWCAIRKLQITSRKSKLKKFLIYSLYAWGVPLVFILAAVIADKHPNTPHYLRPLFGYGGYCMFNGLEAKKIFFAAPGCSLFIINAIFFCHSTYLVVFHSMKSDDSKQTTAKRNYLLYIRLGVIMGVTWLVGIISVFNASEETSLIFNLLNSTQGVFVFLLFICSKKTWQHFRKKVNRKSFVSYFKNTSSSEGCD